MLPAATVRTLTTPVFTAAEFTPDAMGQRRGQGEIRQ